MALNASRLMGWPFRDVVHSYSDRDSMLYALSLGFGEPSTDERQLRFVYEKNLLAVPTMPIVLGMTDLGFLHDQEVGIDLPKMLHGESSLELHAPLPSAPAKPSIITFAKIKKLATFEPDAMNAALGVGAPS